MKKVRIIDAPGKNALGDPAVQTTARLLHKAAESFCAEQLRRNRSEQETPEVSFTLVRRVQRFHLRLGNLQTKGPDLD